MEARDVARVPGVAQLGGAEVPVGADLARDGLQVVTEVDPGGTDPEPVAVVDAVDDEPRFDHERVRDHRVVVRVGVLLDIEGPSTSRPVPIARSAVFRPGTCPFDSATLARIPSEVKLCAGLQLQGRKPPATTPAEDQYCRRAARRGSRSGPPASAACRAR